MAVVRHPLPASHDVVASTRGAAQTSAPPERRATRDPPSCQIGTTVCGLRLPVASGAGTSARFLKQADLWHRPVPAPRQGDPERHFADAVSGSIDPVRRRSRGRHTLSDPPLRPCLTAQPTRTRRYQPVREHCLLREFSRNLARIMSPREVLQRRPGLIQPVPSGANASPTVTKTVAKVTALHFRRPEKTAQTNSAAATTAIVQLCVADPRRAVNRSQTGGSTSVTSPSSTTSSVATRT